MNLNEMLQTSKLITMLEEKEHQLLRLQDENERLLKQSENAEKSMKDAAKLRDENEKLRESEERSRREAYLLQRKLEEAESRQRTVFQDRIVSATICQDCRKSEYDRGIRQQKKLRCMLWMLLGIVALLTLAVVCLLA